MWRVKIKSWVLINSFQLGSVWFGLSLCKCWQQSQNLNTEFGLNVWMHRMMRTVLPVYRFMYVGLMIRHKKSVYLKYVYFLANPCLLCMFLPKYSMQRIQYSLVWARVQFIQSIYVTVVCKESHNIYCWHNCTFFAGMCLRYPVSIHSRVGLIICYDH